MNFKVEVLGFAKYDFEVELNPFFANAGFEYYATSTFEDDCYWVYINIKFMEIKSRLNKQIKQCQANILKHYANKANSATEVLSFL
jgi:Zn-finger protein